MSEAKRTPGPWRIGHNPGDVLGFADRLIANCSGYSDGREYTRLTNIANARFIVLAVNSHDQLVEALASAITRWEGIPSGVDYDADENDTSPEDATAHIAGLAIRELRAALAAAKGEE